MILLKKEMVKASFLKSTRKSKKSLVTKKSMQARRPTIRTRLTRSLAARRSFSPLKTSCMITDKQWEKITRKHPDYEKRVMGDERCAYLAEQWRNAPCLKNWRIDRLYGVGTIGTVVGACHRGGTCAAIKISEINSAAEMRAFQNEITLQNQAAPYAPRVYEYCLFKGSQDKKQYSGLIMEALSGEADEWLSVRRTRADLDDFYRQVRALVEGLCKKGMTHGDLVYFNIAYKKTGSGRMKFYLIDFDRATNDFCDLKVDLSRLILELYPPPISTPQQKELNRDNADYLLPLFLGWAKEVGFSHYEQLANLKTVENYWERAYNSYCRKARVKCLSSA